MWENASLPPIPGPQETVWSQQEDRADLPGDGGLPPGILGLEPTLCLPLVDSRVSRRFSDSRFAGRG